MKTVVFLLLAVVAVSVEPRRCVPGSTIRSEDGCNSCVCKQEDRKFHCNNTKNCPKRRKLSQNGCKPGVRIATKNGCKECICKKDYQFYCYMHKEKCRGGKTKKKLQKECVPGKSFISDGDCNYCKCSRWGKKTDICTKARCTEVRSVKDEPCKLKKKFKSIDGCNTCTCRNKRAMCSMKKCKK